MKNVNFEIQSKKNKVKKYLIYFLFGTSSLITILLVSHWIWMLSGSNQWELKRDEKGVKIYTLKSPGSSLIKVKGITHYKYTLNHLFAPLLDESIQENCADWAPGCLEYKIIEPWNSQLMSNTQLWRFELFFPFSDREMVLKGLVYQDKQSKELLIENIAVPNKIPPNDCCVRVTHAHNTWRYTPLENGEVKLEFIQDIDMGGMFPNFILNLVGPDEIYTMLHTDLPTSLNNEKYRNAKFDFIEELAINK